MNIPSSSRDSTPSPGARSAGVSIPQSERLDTPAGAEERDALRHGGDLREMASRLAEARVVEEALRQSEERLRATYARAPVGIAEADLSGKLTAVNDRLCQFLGYTAQELIGRHIHDITHPEDVQRDRADFGRLSSGELKEYQKEKRYLHRSGQPIWVSVAASGVAGPDGKTRFCIGVIQDISARKHAEESLRQAEAANRRLAAIVESSEDAIIGFNLEGIVSTWNKGAERIFGYRSDQIVGRSIFTIVPDDRHEEEVTLLRRISSGERLEHFETIRRHISGKLLHISLTVSPIKDRDGQVIGASKIARDITFRKEVELQQQALYDLVARVNRADGMPEIFEASLDAICRSQNTQRASILLTDDSGVMRFVASRNLSPAYRAAVEGHSPWKADDPAPSPIIINDVFGTDFSPAISSALASEGIGSLIFVPLTYEKKLLGKFMVYFDRPQRVRRSDLQAAETIASQVAFAITRRRDEQALEALVRERTASLREAIAQMEEFSYSVSHDLRSPVRAMQGYAAALLEDYSDKLDSQGKNHLQRIVRNGARMDRLIQDVLVYSRLTRREIELRPVDLNRLLNELLTETLEFQRLSRHIRIEAPLPVVLAHEASLQQVLYNLISNALKFVAPGQAPEVTIKARPTSPGRIRISIIDRGIGIKPEYHHRLFGIFERVHPDQDYEGTGIGLAIVRKAVDRMNGAVGVISDGTHGSEFWIELNTAPAAA